MAETNPASGPLPLEMIAVDVTSIQAPEAVALEQVNWTVSEGQYWVVGGLPGSGQSDLIGTAAGLVRPHSGVHRLFGQELTRLHEADRVRAQLQVGVVFGAGGRLFNDLTVSENVALPWCYHHNHSLLTQQERVRVLLAEIGLESVSGLTPNLVNRNQRQRIALARALMLSPALLFMDFPFVGIDTRETQWTLQFLEKLRQGHPLLDGRTLTLVVATDDLLPWGDYPCQYGLLQDKHFVAFGRREELLRRRDASTQQALPPAWLKD